jgi:RimJ/RimL family protein N-acetyltransferase
MSVPKAPEIEIKPWNEADWPVAFYWFEADWDLQADDYYPRDLDVFVELHRSKGSISFGVHVDGELAGIFIFLPVSPIVIDVHCVFARSFRDGRTAFAAAQIILKAIWRMGYRKISCVAFENNHRVIRLIERMGGIYEGLLLGHMQKNGRPANLVSYGILREDWLALIEQPDTDSQ